MKQDPGQTSIARRTLSALVWVAIATLAAATLWAAHQPKVHSIRGEPSEKPIASNPIQSGAAQGRPTFSFMSLDC